MSNSYYVVPLQSECAAWLEEEGVSHPPASAKYRLPSLEEVEVVLSALEEYGFSIRRCNVTPGWIVDIFSKEDPSKGPWTELVLSDAPQVAFSFSGGWHEPIFTVVEKLSHVCGPLAVADGADATPYLVVPGLSLETMLVGYDSRRTRRST